MKELSPETGVIIIDHGSRRAEANSMLECVADLYAAESGAAVVEHAHMELAEPTLPQAFARCVARGARHVVISLFFLSPGRHGKQDIPAMAAEAAAKFPGVTYSVTEPLGVHPLLGQLLHKRVLDALPREE